MVGTLGALGTATLAPVYQPGYDALTQLFVSDQCSGNVYHYTEHFVYGGPVYMAGDIQGPIYGIDAF
jgi:hypothetical protein